jgi:carbamoyl-phosphate synthase large subunit
MDINPRFSAGISFSILAGYDMVKNHLNCFMDNEIETNINYKTMIIAKKLSDVITHLENNKHEK